MKNEKIREYLNENLSGLYVTANRHKDLFAEIVEGKKMKRKLTVGIILLITLLIITVTALAITISEVVRANMLQVVQMQEENGFLTRWEQRDKEEYVQLLLDHELIAAEDAGQLMDAWEYPDDAIRFTTKLAYGDSNHWTIDQRAWLDEVLVACGIMKEPVNITPQDGDMKQNEAEALARNAIVREYPKAADVIDSYEAAIRYVDNHDGNGPIWQLEYSNPSSATGRAEYHVNIYNQGKDVSVSSLAQDTLESYFESLVTEKGPFRFWSIADKYEFIQNLPNLCAREKAQDGIVPDVLLGLMEHQYGLPTKDDLTLDEAVNIAKALLSTNCDIAKETADSLDIAAFFYIDDIDHPVWSIEFYRGNKQYTVEVPAKDGAAKITYDINVHDAGIDISSALDKAQQFEAELKDKYPDPRLWSLADKARLDELNEAAGAIINVKSVMPIDGDISESEAIAAAKAALNEKGMPADEYQTAVSLFSYKSGGRFWFIEFFKTESSDAIYAKVAPDTGIVMEIRQSCEPNG